MVEEKKLLGDKLKEFRKAKGLSVLEFSRVYGLKKDSVYKWEKGTKPSTIDDYIKLENIINEKITNQVSDPLPTYTTKRFNLKNSDSEPIPVYLGNTQAGIIQVYSDDPDMNTPVSHLPSDVFPSCNHAERVSGNSMYPQIQNHAIIIGKIIDKQGIIFGDIYSIHTKHGLSVVKYVHPSNKKECVKLVSYNKEVPPTDVALNDITFCCRILYIVNPS